jgi:hypothetical protein
MDEGRTYVSAADLATLSTALITRHPDFIAGSMAASDDLERHRAATTTRSMAWWPGPTG